MPLRLLIPRGVLGGVLMGLANLVPGISGGTMLLAAGVYPIFIHSIALVTRLRLELRALIVLATIGGSAVGAIGLLAGPTKTLVIEHRPLMYSFFIGLTLGGLPLVWRLAKPITRSVWIAAGLAFALMVVMALEAGGGGGGAHSLLLLMLAGVAGASAMILPGISGGYLLLLLGQYEPILGAIDGLKQGLIGAAGLDTTRVADALTVVLPVGVGIVIGIVVVSNALEWLLEHYEKPTLGILIGLLVGAVVGLYPFQEAVPPEAGFTHRGIAVPTHALHEVPIEQWPLETFTPDRAQLATSLAAGLSGLLITFVIARLGEDRETAADPAVASDESGAGHPPD